MLLLSIFLSSILHRTIEGEKKDIATNKKKEKNNLKLLNKLLNDLDYDEGIKIVCTNNNSTIFINKNINNEFIIQIEHVIQNNKKEILYFGKKNDLINFILIKCTSKFNVIEY
jgi:hypothetical protein